MKTKITLCCIASLLLGITTDATAQSTNPTVYSGYTLPFPVPVPNVPPASIDSILPYGMVTAQDVYPLMTGYGLTTLADQAPAKNPAGSYDSVFTANPTTPGQYQPSFSVDQPVWLSLGSMLSLIPSDKLGSYYDSQSNIFLDFSDLPSIQPVINSGTTYANTPSQNNFIYNINGQFGAPYFAGSLFNYVPQTSSLFAKYSAYQYNPGEVYISLVSGGLTPPPSIDKPTEEYLPQVRRLAAIQTAGVYALQNIFNRSLPMNNTGDNPLVQALQGYPDANHIPKSQRDLEKFMATRRLNPQSGWYQHLQQASPTELQREQIYLQAEILYELYQVHQTEEQNQMLLAVNLLGQNYDSRLMLNQMQQITSAIKPPK